MTGAMATIAGTPAALSALTAAMRLRPAGARGSSVREISGVSEVTDDSAREAVYGMPYGEWKKKYQKEATPEQLAKMAETTAGHKH